ncbi:MAG: nucleotide disphospho-sugar-binding domain-containing protein [Pseudomonadota bacterium]
MRILFIGEAVTLSHVVRPLALARAAAGAGHEVIYAVDERYNAIIGERPFRTIPLVSAFAPAETAHRLKYTAPVFDYAILDSYVQEDLRLLKLIQPDLVVGDMRQSLGISARLMGVPYAATVNAHWSPYGDFTMAPATHPLRGLMSPRSFEALFAQLFPIGSAVYTFPFNAVRAKYGFPVGPVDIRDLFTDGDYVLHPDIPLLTPTVGAPDTHRFLGPIIWTAQTPIPDWWDQVPSDKPVVAVNLGSSGEPDLLDDVVAGLRAHDVTVILATAGRRQMAAAPPALFTADYLPADAVAARADLVVCSGGCMPVHPILAAGKPILSLPSNLDQLITARMYTRLGIGEHIEEERTVSPGTVRTLTSRILRDPRYTEAAVSAGAALSQLDAGTEFLRFLSELEASAAVAA